MCIRDSLDNLILVAHHFETVLRRLFQSYLIQMYFRKSSLQNVVNRDAEIFRCRHLVLKLWNVVQILMVEALEHMFAYRTIEDAQVTHHPGLPRHRPADAVSYTHL